MRKLAVVLMVMLCTSCALLSFEIQKAPLKPDQAVVFDIDGTLTPSRLAIYTAREDAAKAVRVFADAGYKIIYLSARTQLFQSGIPNWLKENHFPEGSINVPQTDKDSSDHAAFKERVLNAYKKNGWTFVAAYGDSVTDFEAYTKAGIPKERVFALQRAGEKTCQGDPSMWNKCLHSWAEHMNEISADLVAK
jgi:phosphatidate phosphatase PAH1